MVTKAKRMANEKYRREKRDQIAVDVPKGKRDVYKRIAAELNLSLSQLIQCSVESYATNGGGVNSPAQTTPITTQPTDKISDRDKKILNAVNQLPTEAQKSLIKFLQSLNAQQVTTAVAAENAAENATVDAQEPI